MKKHQIIKLLSLPDYRLCSWCDRVFREGGCVLDDYQIDLGEISDEVKVSHGLCPECFKKEEAKL